MVEIYSRALKERYLASRCSLAYLFRACWYICLVIPPVYIAYSTGGFWRRIDSYFEQPKVVFTKNLIIQALASDGSAVFHYSTMEKYNYLMGYDNVRQPSIKSWQVDSNLDGLADSWNINLVFPLSASTDKAIVSATALVFFHATYLSQINLDMDAMVQLNAMSNGVRGNKWVTSGDLTLYQRNAFKRTGGNIRNVYATPLVSDASFTGIDDTDLSDIMLKNQARNETLRYDMHQLWSQTPTSSFNMSFQFTVPNSQVLYIPSAGETIKFAFIQWLAMFWLMYFFLKFIREFVFSQNIVDTMRITDGTPVAKLHQF